MAGIFDFDQFIKVNSQFTPINLASTDDPNTVQRLEQAKQAGYNDRAAKHNGTPEAFSGFQPQTLTEKAAYREGATQYDSDVNAERDMGDAITDTALGVVSGIASGVGSLAGLAEANVEGLLNPYATWGETVSRNLDAVDKVANLIRSPQSDELQARQRAQQARANIQKQLDQAQYEQDLANGMNPNAAGLKDFGRDVTRFFTTQDSATLMDSTAQGIGSLFGPGIVGKGVGLAGSAVRASTKAVTSFTNKLNSGALGRTATVGTGALKNAGKEAVENASKAGIFDRIPTKWKDATVMGSLEASSNAMQTNAEVLNTPIEDLRALPEFNNLVQEFVSEGSSLELAEERARNTLAGIASNYTALYSAPLAIAASSIASRMAHPFQKFSTKADGTPLNFGGKVNALTKDMRDESIEEGLQGIFGSAAGNLTAQQLYDKDRSLFDDAGYAKEFLFWGIDLYFKLKSL